MTQAAPQPDAGILSVDGLRFSWIPGEPPVLDIESFAVAKGERVFLRGASGSGKSTLLSLLGGVVLPDAGEVHVSGQNIAQLKRGQRDRFRADTIGFIFQMFNLVPYLSLVQNVELPCRFSPARLARATANGTLEAEAIRLLEQLGLDRDMVHRRASDLSVGQQQRVAAARALLGNPPLVIADEPTSALDADAREAFINLLFQECSASGSTVLFVSHDQSLAPLFDRSIDLADINRASI